MTDYHAMIEISHINDTSAEPFALPEHGSESVRLLYVESGQFTIVCGEHSLCADTGDILFINRNIPRPVISSASKGGRLCSCVINPVAVFGLGSPDWEQQYLIPILYDSSLHYLHITNSQDAYERCASCLSEIIELDAGGQNGCDLLIRADLLRIWHELCQYTSAAHVTSASQASMQDEHRVREAIAYIQRHYTGAVTLEDIADSVMVSKNECCRCFKRTLGITPFEYLMKYRVTESAKRMRQYPLESISQIAGSVGFNNASYFNRLFKKYMGCTPTEFKRRITPEPLS